MSYLSREAAPFDEELWDQIDNAVVKAASKVLCGRRFLHIFGPLGMGTTSINIDKVDQLEEVEQDGFVTVKGRQFVQIPSICEDFTLLARDLEASCAQGLPVDLHKAEIAAQACAIREDKLIFWGNPELGYEGLINAADNNKISKGDWFTGENAFADIAAAKELLISKGIYGTYALALSTDLYMQLQRLQPGTGLLEIERVKKLVDGNVFQTVALGKNKAVLVCSEPSNMDLVIGQDMAAAYLEQKDLNHVFRITESILLRIKRPQAIVVLE